MFQKVAEFSIFLAYFLESSPWITYNNRTFTCYYIPKSYTLFYTLTFNFLSLLKSFADVIKYFYTIIPHFYQNIQQKFINRFLFPIIIWNTFTAFYLMLQEFSNPETTIEHSRESLIANLFQYSSTIAEYFISRGWNSQWIMI